MSSAAFIKKKNMFYFVNGRKHSVIDVESYMMQCKTKTLYICYRVGYAICT